MSWLVAVLVRWFVHAAVTFAAVRAVTPNNPANTLARGLLVTFLVAILVTPLTGWLAIFLVPLLIAFVAWIAIYMLAYQLGPLQAVGVGIVQVLIGWAIGLLLRTFFPGMRA